MKIRILRSWRGAGFQKNTFWGSTDHCDHFWLCQIFMFFLAKPKNHLLSSILIKNDKIRKIDFNWRQVSYSEEGIASIQNSVVPKILTGGAEGLKSQKLFLLEPIGRQYKTSQLEGLMWGLFSFMSLQKSCSFPMSLSNWANCKKMKFCTQTEYAP